MVTSYIINTLIYEYFSPSLLELAALETFNGAINPSNSFFLASTLLSECFVSCVNGRSIHLHPSNRVSFSLIKAWDRVRFRARSLAHSRIKVVRFVRLRARLFFVSNLLRFVFARLGGRSLHTKERVGDGIRSCALPKECRPFFPKTTVSWLLHIYFIGKRKFQLWDGTILESFFSIIS